MSNSIVRDAFDGSVTGSPHSLWASHASTVPNTAMSGAVLTYSLTPWIAGRGAFRIAAHKLSTAASSFAAGTTSLTMPKLSARSGVISACEYTR